MLIISFGHNVGHFVYCFPLGRLLDMRVVCADRCGFVADDVAGDHVRDTGILSVSEITEGGVLEENEGARGWREVLRDAVPQTPWDLAHYACSGRG